VVDFANSAGVPDPPLADVRLAVSEAVTNVVIHGYRSDGEPGPVDVAAEVEGGRIHIVVGDEGVGFAPRIGSPGAGMGLPIIATIADSFELTRRDPHGSELHVSFKL